jgi:hypothetical protein
MKYHPALLNRLVDLLMNKKLSIEIVESFAFIIAYALHHRLHDLHEDQIMTLLSLLDDNHLN